MYTEENYWKRLSGVDYIIDTLGEKEFAHELSILKEGGILLSLRTAPNKSYAKKMVFHYSNRFCFHWQDENMTGWQNIKVRSIDSFLCVQMGCNWRKLLI